MLLHALKADPWVEHLIRARAYGFRRTGNPTTTYFLEASSFTAIWTCCQGDGLSKARCIVFDTSSAPQAWPRSSPSPLRTGQKPALAEYLGIFKDESASPLFLPSTFATMVLHNRQGRLSNIWGAIRTVESKTGHGSYISNQLDPITHLAADLGASLNSVANTVRLVQVIEDVFGYIQHAIEDTDRLETKLNKEVGASNHNILAATTVLQRECASIRGQCQYYDVRIRSQSSVLFSFLSHQDNEVNAGLANASKRLAEAAQQDSSSMKTVAVITMAFLPAAFFAALFSMPALGWNEPAKFGTYWTFTVPTTLVTFALWTYLTQYEQARKTIRSLLGSTDSPP
ncbi:hypothetical protein OQA88_1480 [Cercophora sp. LCS_1]